MPFKVTAKTDMNKVEIGQEFEESDFATLTDEGFFVQMKYETNLNEEDKKKETIPVKPGIWRIQQGITSPYLEKAEFTEEKILDEFVNTRDVIEKISCFFKNIDVYKKYGRFPKRGILLYGVPGVGKSTVIHEICKKYMQADDTAIIIWDTVKHDASFIKDVLDVFEYENNVKQMIFIMEDIGGVEVESSHSPRAADSSLLKLLDNTEKTFKIPSLILATTNFPENLLSSLANRPGRFDDKIEVLPPNGDARVKLFAFFVQQARKCDKIDAVQREDYEESCKYLISNNCENKGIGKLTPAHIADVVIRSEIYSITYLESLKSVIRDVNQYKNAFKPVISSVGFNK